MANIKMIAAVGHNLELGKDNDLIWHLKEDMAFFKEQTMGHKIIMGYNTYLSLPKHLKGREYIILTHRDINLDNGLIFHEIKDLINYLSTLNEDVYVIGGATIYKEFLEYANELILTEIEDTKEASVYFPNFDKKLYNKEILSSLEEDGIKFKHVKYTKKV